MTLSTTTPPTRIETTISMVSWCCTIRSNVYCWRMNEWEVLALYLIQIRIYSFKLRTIGMFIWYMYHMVCIIGFDCMVSCARFWDIGCELMFWLFILSVNCNVNVCFVVSLFFYCFGVLYCEWKKSSEIQKNFHNAC